MKILRKEILTNEHLLKKDDAIGIAFQDILDSIHTVNWPANSKTFKINPVKQGNGVKPIKNNCMAYLKDKHWELELKIDIAARIKPGPIDAGIQLEDGRYAAIEWETGNISSSHRAMNKLALGSIRGLLALGVLVLPSRDMYRYLTDRVGNFAELLPYFDIWRGVKSDGILAVIEVEHDELDPQVVLIPKGTDGRALR